MLYVKDVEKISAFWKKINFIEIERQELEGFTNVTMAPSIDSNARFQIWNIEFIKRYSPEVANMKASILFEVDNIEEWNHKLKEITETTGDIMDNGGKQAFNFADPEGNYYGISEK